jgi:TRAP-type C4-dicarboxylate transport system substrate-binding protein
MEMKRVIRNLAVFGIAVAIFCPGVTFAASGKAITLSYATFRPPSDVVAKPWLEGMSKEVEERTEGRIKIKIYWSGALGEGKDQFYMVRDGIADMADFPGPWIAGKFSNSEVANLPFAAENPLNVVKAMNLMDEKGYFKEWGEVAVLGFHATTAYDIFMRKDKPMTFDALAGMKVRTPGGVITDYLKHIKMVPVKVLPSDAYMAWETGLVDAWLHLPSVGMRYKFNELPTCCILDANVQILGNAATIMNKEKLASLPMEDQKIVREVVHKHGAMYVTNCMEQDEIAIKKMAEQGIETYRMPEPEMQKFRKAGVAMWEKYIADMEAKGLPGKELVAEYVLLLKQFGENPIYQP